MPLAEIAALTYKKFGADGLRELLAHDVPTRQTRPSRESILDIAAELTAMGLQKLALIAVEIAATKPPMTDIDAFCPYERTQENKHNITCWLRAQRQRRLCNGRQR